MSDQHAREVEALAGCQGFRRMSDADVTMTLEAAAYELNRRTGPVAAAEALYQLADWYAAGWLAVRGRQQ